MYVETYGQGKPLLLIHGNGGQIKHMKNQIDYFRKSRRVIVADTRGHGQSTDPGTAFTYESLAEDYAALLDSLKLTKVDIFGWSDGAILGILIAKIRPQRLDKVYAFAANTKTGAEGILPKTYAALKKMVASMPTKTPAEQTAKRIAQMMENHPNIAWSTLRSIQVPIMVATADHDMIPLRHSAMIYQNLPKAAIQVFSQANHFLPWEDPERLNREVERFFNKPFTKQPYSPKEYAFLFP